jgi:hypothetical protein
VSRWIGLKLERPLEVLPKKVGTTAGEMPSDFRGIWDSGRRRGATGGKTSALPLETSPIMTALRASIENRYQDVAGAADSSRIALIPVPDHPIEPWYPFRLLVTDRHQAECIGRMTEPVVHRSVPGSHLGL